MIKINLYPESKKSKLVFSIKLEVGIYLAVLLVLVLSMLYVTSILNSNINSLTEQKRQKQRINRILLKKVSTIREYKKQIKILKQKIKIIKKIRKKQNLPVIYLTELVKKFIRNKLWFTYLTLNSNRIYIRGVALDNQILADYIKALRQSPYVQQIDLRRSSKKQIRGYDLITFSFSLTTKK